MKLEEINFKSRLPMEKHSRYPEFRQLIGLRDFAAYREVFERGWAETSIMCGEYVRLHEHPLDEEEPPNTSLVNLMGTNHHSPKRVRLAKEFFQEYDRLGRSRFLKEAAHKTGYVRDLMDTAEFRTGGLKGVRGLLARRAQQKGLQYRIVSYLNTYDNMKQFGQLVHGAHVAQEHLAPIESGDVPWAIDYLGYLKLRDGAHRRAIAHALDWPVIPTLVFEFSQVTRENLGDAPPYIQDNFNWFAEIMQAVASQQSASPSVKTV